MIFPIGDEQVQGGSKPIFSYAFIGLNIIIFLYQFTLPPQACQAFIFSFGTIPSEIVAGDDYYTILTSMFLHGGWMHLIGNMLFLWVFADNIEAIAGNIPFFGFYILGGIFASLVHLFFNMESNVPAVGASGAISAVLGAYLVMFPKSKIKMFVVYFFRSFYIPALWFLGFWILQQFIAGIGSLAQTADTGGVAWWAHIGGFVFGVVAGYFLKKDVDPGHGLPGSPEPVPSMEDTV